MADNTLINLCRQKITISRLRATYGLSAEIPPLIANGDIDFESIDEKAIELLLHIARSSGWTIREYDMDMSVFTKCRRKAPCFSHGDIRRFFVRQIKYI